MKNYKRNLCYSLALSFAFVGCAQNKKMVEASDINENNESKKFTSEDKASRKINNKLAHEAEANYFVEIEFKEGSSRLDSDSKMAINSLINRAQVNGKVDEIKVLAWADQEFPSTDRKKLSDSQRELADSRNDRVEDYIESLREGIDVDTYNMAERPTIVERWFNTSDARFKKTLVNAGIPTTADDPKYPQKASRAVVLLSLE